MKALDGFPLAPKKGKGGRPTVGENFLLGSRNGWRDFFEESWPDIGGMLLRIQKCEGSTIEDVRKAFDSIKGRPRSELAVVFFHSSSVTVAPQELIRQKIAWNKMLFEIQELRKENAELERSLTQAENAFKALSKNERPTLRDELDRRAEVLRKNQESILTKRRECVELETEIRDGETRIYLSELLDFLRSGRRALNPMNLANALAGLPDMRWRQSDTRCSKMNEDHYPLHPYSVFLAVEYLCKRASAISAQSVVDSFQTALSKLPARDKRDFLCEHWRDFRLAIEEVCKAKPDADCFPHALTSVFLRNVNRQKDSKDQVEDDRERLVLKTKPIAKNMQRVK